jgi:nucleoside-diphosphate-sugar epimerase
MKRNYSSYAFGKNGFERSQDAPMTPLTIAVLGSTSQIAKCLIDRFLLAEKSRLHLFTRSPEKLRLFLRDLGRGPSNNCEIHEGYSIFGDFHYDVLINCIGIGTLKKHRGDYSAYFTVTEEFDNLVIEYLLRKYGDAIYLSISSGAVYGRNHSGPVEEFSVNPVRVNQLEREDYYGIARLNAEAKHRSFQRLSIIDLRVFSFFSRYIDLNDGYFINEVINCLRKKDIFYTDSLNIVRDYIHPEDLYGMVLKCMAAKNINSAFDAHSKKPITKKEMLEYFRREKCLLFGKY